MLSLGDAVKVAKSLVAGRKDDDAIIRQEMVQKCRNDDWRQQTVSAVAEMMNKVISGINSTEICNQIASDNLRKWCERTQCELRIAMNYLPYQGKALSSAQPEINSSEIPNTSDAVSRKAVRDMVATWSYDLAEWEDMELALHDVEELPPAQDFHIDFADLRAEQEERNIATPILNPNGNME